MKVEIQRLACFDQILLDGVPFNRATARALVKVFHAPSKSWLLMKSDLPTSEEHAEKINKALVNNGTITH